MGANHTEERGELAHLLLTTALKFIVVDNHTSLEQREVGQAVKDIIGLHIIPLAASQVTRHHKQPLELLAMSLTPTIRTTAMLVR